jgi:hypothetical protein
MIMFSYYIALLENCDASYCTCTCIYYLLTTVYARQCRLNVSAKITLKTLKSLSYTIIMHYLC